MCHGRVVGIAGAGAVASRHHWRSCKKCWVLEGFQLSNGSAAPGSSSGLSAGATSTAQPGLGEALNGRLRLVMEMALCTRVSTMP